MTAQTLQQGRHPRINLFYPDWWNGHGTRIKLRQIDPLTRKLVLGASAASLEISPHTEKPFIKGWDWNIRWEVVQAYPDYKATGLVVFSSQELAAAFCLSDYPGIGGEYSQWVLDRFGGDCAVQGKFIRHSRGGIAFLNIPCPGTGHDGDPNISLEVTKKIQRVVGQLLISS